jgi:hypothetical protein
MPSRARTAAAALLALGILVLSRSGGRGDEVEEARNDLLKMADKLAAGKRVSAAQVRAFTATYDSLLDVMQIFKGPPRGLDIEKRIYQLSTGKAVVDKKTSAKERAELRRLLLATQAVAEVLPGYQKKFTKGDNVKDKEWDGFNSAMKTSAAALVKAVDAGDPKAARKAATALYESCNDCHGKFRVN